MKLSVLDQSPIRAGGTPAQAVAESLELARQCDRWGYHRYWVAEHHSSAGLAGTCPEILIGRLASVTERIRVGSGGVMLSHYASLKVAEQFRMLETLFPGRIDIGIGRAPGSDGVTAAALAHGPGRLDVQQFPYQVQDLIQYLDDELPDDHPFAGIHAMPTGDGVPEMWLLGSSDQSAMMAAHFGVPFSFAHFISGAVGQSVVRGYRQGYRPSARYPQPLASACIFVVCADTDEEADQLAMSRALWRLRVETTGQITPFPTTEEALAYPYTEAERARIAANRQREVVGGVATVKARLEELAEGYGSDEMVIVTITHGFAARLRSYELLAEAFALAG